MDLIADNREYTLTMDAPGTLREDVDVRAGPVPGTIQLTLNAEIAEEASGTWLRAERRAARRSGKLSRIVAIGWDADVARTSKRIENGVLTVKVPRRPQEPIEGERSQA